MKKLMNLITVTIMVISIALAACTPKTDNTTADSTNVKADSLTDSTTVVK